MKLKQTILLAVLLIAGCSFDPARYPTGHRPGDTRHIPTLESVEIPSTITIPITPVAGRTGLPSDKAPYKRWTIYFYYPKGLKARATDLVVYTNSGLLYKRRIRMVSLNEDKNSVGGWYNKTKFLYYDSSELLAPPDNPDYQLPLSILFCWVSYVDHKLYQTEIQFSPALWQKMQTQADHPDSSGKPFWYDTLLIGLAPGGKTKVWLQDHNEEYPNIPVTPVTTITKSDEQIVCHDFDRAKGISIPVGFDYVSQTTDEETKEFIKGKTYPYGNW